MPTSVVLVAEFNGNVLATSRKDNHEDFGLPGGKVEIDELPEQALRREVKEETGLTLLDVEEVYEGTERDWIVKVFTAKTEGEIYTEENIVVDWVPWQKVLDGSFGAFNKKLFDFLKK